MATNLVWLPCTRVERYQLFQIDTILIRYQRFLVVSIQNFDTDASKFEPSRTVLLHVTHYRCQNGFGQLWKILTGIQLMILRFQSNSVKHT